MAFASILLSLSAAYSVLGPYPPMYGVWFSCSGIGWEVGGSIYTALSNRVDPKTFCLIISPPLTDCLAFLSSRCNVASFSLSYSNIHAHCSFELAKCMRTPHLFPRYTKHSTFSPPYSVHLYNARVNQYLHSYVLYTDKLWNSLPCVCFSSCLRLKLFQKRSVKIYLMLTIPPPIASFLLLSSLQGLVTSKFFFNLILFSLKQCSFNVK